MQLTYMTICINTERLHNSLENIGYPQTAKKKMTILQLQFKALSAYFKIKK